VVFNTGPYTVLPDNSILITANMQSETGFPSSHQLQYNVASKSRLKLAARAVLSADAGLLVDPVSIKVIEYHRFYSAPHCKRSASYGNSVRLSVCPSACLSHAGIVSKRP